MDEMTHQYVLYLLNNFPMIINLSHCRKLLSCLNGKRLYTGESSLTVMVTNQVLATEPYHTPYRTLLLDMKQIDVSAQN